MELAALIAGSLALGALRPRRTTMLAATVPACLSFAWLLMHEDIPGDTLGFVDLIWYAGMSCAVGMAFALAIAAGVVLGRAAGGSLGPRSR
jgi:hypothetical protein